MGEDVALNFRALRSWVYWIQTALGKAQSKIFFAEVSRGLQLFGKYLIVYFKVDVIFMRPPKSKICLRFMGFRVLSLIWVFSDSFFIYSKLDLRIKSREMSIVLSFVIIARHLGCKWGERSNFQYNLHLRRGISSKEENGAGLVVSDEEEEWAVSFELTSYWATQRHCKKPRGTTCFSALFIDFQNRLLDGLGHNQAIFHRDS